MQQISLKSEHPLSPFVKSIILLENDDSSSSTCLPFYADGFPGLIYHNAGTRLRVHPHNKQFPPIFFYGQTIHPIEIRIIGSFQLIIFQLYPFVSRSLFNIDLASLTDGCKDLTPLFGHIEQPMPEGCDLKARVAEISELLNKLVLQKSREFDPGIRTAVEKILRSKGQSSLKELANELGISSRSLERKFLQHTALKPKQFAKIIQFQSSLTQLSVKDYKKLTDIVYENGYADQSHFIRVFKSFTGKVPSKFL
ncbi:MAG: helix-turn-helix domain-containing protein [Chitinophagaceae bacterium]